MTFQILNTKVIFQARKYGSSGSGEEVIEWLTFNKNEINIGDGFIGSAAFTHFGWDHVAGVFVVPIDGIYKMTFSGQSATSRRTKQDIVQGIRVYKGRQFLRIILDSNEGTVSFSSTWMMKLVKGDEIRIWSNNYLWVNTNTPLIFTGELIHTD